MRSSMRSKNGNFIIAMNDCLGRRSKSATKCMKITAINCSLDPATAHREPLRMYWPSHHNRQYRKRLM